MTITQLRPSNSVLLSHSETAKTLRVSLYSVMQLTYAKKLGKPLKQPRHNPSGNPLTAFTRMWRRTDVQALLDANGGDCSHLNQKYSRHRARPVASKPKDIPTLH